MKVCVLGTGSAGNATLVEAESRLEGGPTNGAVGPCRVEQTCGYRG